MPLVLSQDSTKVVTAQPPAEKQFRIGEYYKYRIDWLGVPVGFVTFEIEGEAIIEKKAVYIVTLTAETNKFASKIYNIRDTYTSYIDKDQLVPVRYDVNRSEGNYRKKAMTLFDHKNGKAYFENYLDGSKKSYSIPEGVLDPISAILKAKTFEMVVGDCHMIDVANNESVYKIYTHIPRKDHLLIKDMGEYEAFFVSPYAILNGVKVKKGTVSGYISSDAERKLLYAEVQAPLFTKLTGTLIETRKDKGENSKLK